MIAETFETACTWAGFAELDAAVRAAATVALDEVCGGGLITCRFTHVYPDGPAPYYGDLRARPLAATRWRSGTRSRRPCRTCSTAGKRRSRTTTPSAVTTGPGTTTSDRIRSPPRMAAAKGALDPAGILNPGVLLGVMNQLYEAVLGQVNRTSALNGQAFDPATPVPTRRGTGDVVHYGVMVPGLPEPIRFLDAIVILGTARAPIFGSARAAGRPGAATPPGC